MPNSKSVTRSGAIATDNQREELYSITSNLEDRVLSIYALNLILHSWFRIFHKPLHPYAAGLIASFLVFLSGIVASLIFRQPFVPIVYHLLFVSLMPGFTIVAIKLGHDNGVKMLISMTDHFTDSETYTAIKVWLLKVFNLRKQIIVSFFFALLGCGMAFIWHRNSSTIPIYFSSYIVTFLASLALGNGAYVAFSVPTIMSEVSKYRIRLYSFGPAEAAFIRRTKSGFATLTFAYAVVFSLVLLEFYQLRPYDSVITMQAALYTLLLVLGLISWLFLYPHYFLSKIAKREKWIILDDIQARIDQLYSNHNPLDSKSVEEIKTLIEFYNMAKLSPSSSLSFAGWRTYFTSLILPTLSFLSGVVNWKGILSKIGL